MAYVEEFRARLASRNFPKIVELWHEYCGGAENADGEEILQILGLLKESDFAPSVGELIEAILPLAIQISDQEQKIDALKAIFDLQTTNSETLYSIAQDFLTTLFSSDPAFTQKLRLVGMRTRENFQGVLSNFYLLNHIEKGNFVLHTAGWGVGEIIDFSFIREQLCVEFENLQGGKRDISFKNAFKTLLPIDHSHFLARRFRDPDSLEEDAKKNPVEIIRGLLKNLGPKSASEIKELLCDFVIYEEEYSKWWQLARSKLKKDSLIESPQHPKDPFFLRKGKVSFDDRVEKAFSGKFKMQDLIARCYALLRDFPEILKNDETKKQVVSKLQELLSQKPSASEEIQILLLLDDPLNVKTQDTLNEILKKLAKEELEATIQNIEIITFKKRVLSLIKTIRADFSEIFLDLLYAIEPNQLKDYLLKKLSNIKSEVEIKAILQKLVNSPKTYPEAVFWYFQKVASGDDTFFQDSQGKAHFFEAFLTLFAYLDSNAQYRDLAKKMYHFLTSGRFKVIRALFADAEEHFVREYLLLASKCQSFSTHDLKVLQSLAEVAHPALCKATKAKKTIDPHVIWTTREGYTRTHERIKHIGTVEMVANAKEIEQARAHGDLRENAEYKAALERRSRLQAELKMLSDQFRHARIITKDDIAHDHVGIGVRVDLKGQNDQVTSYTILGPWDADPAQNILSFQSKFVQDMLGKKVGDTCSLKDEPLTIIGIHPLVEEIAAK